MGDRLKGKVAIVTGAGAVPGAEDRPPIGNGKASAIVYAREGAKVLLVDISSEMAKDTQRIIDREGGTCSVFQGDVSNPDSCRAISKACLEAFGRIDILHNNVGIAARKPGGLLEVDEEDWDYVMNINLKSMFHLCRAVVPQMLKQGSGVIVNISSVSALMNLYPQLFIYTISKAAVNSFTRCLAMEFADKGIRVNAIMPGMMDTPTIYKALTRLYSGDLEKMRRDRNERIPMKHMGEPWDIAYASLFLVSEEAKYITGQILAVDGGILLATGLGKS